MSALHHSKGFSLLVLSLKIYSQCQWLELSHAMEMTCLSLTPTHDPQLTGILLPLTLCAWSYPLVAVIPSSRFNNP